MFQMRPPMMARATAGGGGGSDPHFANTILLLGFEGADASTTFTDESAAARGNASVFSGAQVDTAQFKYGAASLLLNGSSDYISYPQSADFNFGTGAFTVELFARFNAVGNVCWIGNRNSGGLGWRFLRNGTTLQFEAGAGGTLGVSWTPTTGQWYHICADRPTGGETRVYIDGVMLQKGGTAGNITDSTIGLFIGRLPSSGAFYHNGWIDEVRITKGVGRYGSDSGFTIPAAAYPRS